MKMRTNIRSNSTVARGERFALWARNNAKVGFAVAAIGILPNLAQAQIVPGWTFDITNGNGAGAGGNRVFNLNALLNAGQPFTVGSILNGLSVSVNAGVTNTSTGSSLGDSLFYIGSVGPVYFVGNNPVPNFTPNGAFLNDPGILEGGMDNFLLGTLNASAWLNTLNPGGNAPVVFTGSFRHTLSADIEDTGFNTVASLPDITPGDPSGPTVQFEATIRAAGAVVPEPGSLALLTALGAVGSVFAARRRK